MKKLFIKYKEIITYVFFGVLSTIVSWGSYIIFERIFSSVGFAGESVKVFTANILSWLCAITFAFVTNKMWVFDSKSWKADIIKKEISTFVSSRIATGIIEIVGVPLLSGIGTDKIVFALLKRTALKDCGFLFSDGFYSKILISIIVVILNYVFSKLFVFRDEDKGKITLSDCVDYTSAFVKKHRMFFSALAAAITTASFYLKGGARKIPEKITSSVTGEISGFLYHVTHSVRQIDIFSLIIFFACFYFYAKRKPYKAKRSDKTALYFLSLFAAFMLLLCRSYFQLDSWDAVFANTYCLIIALFRILGFGTGIYCVLSEICNYINRPYIITVAREKAAPAAELKKSFWIYVSILLIAWLPYMVLLYPGSITPDVKDEIAQIVGNKDFSWSQKSVVLLNENVLLNNHHPVFYTAIIALVIQFGKLIGSYGAAFEIYCLIQSFLFACTISYSVIFTKKRFANKKFITAQILFFALNPTFGQYAMTVVKDTPYCILMLLSVIEIYECLTVEKISFKRCAALFATLLPFLLVRNNTVYILILFLIILFASLIKKDKKRLVKIGSTVLVSVLVFQIGFVNILYPALDITPGSKREMFSVPFQQTARYIKEHPDEIDKEDEETILKLFTFDSLDEIAQAYNPLISDPVKNQFNKYATDEDIANYMKVWFKQLKTHPDTYVQAFLNLQYHWFSFEGKRGSLYSTYKRSKLHLEKMLDGFDDYKGFRTGRKIASDLYRLCQTNPVTTAFVNFASYTWIYVFLLFYSIKRRKKNSLIANSIVFINYIICFVSPIAYTRYAVPMMTTACLSVFITISEKSAPCKKKVKMKAKDKKKEKTKCTLSSAIVK